MITAFTGMMRNKTVMLGAVIFVSAVAAIIFERAMNDLIFDYMHPIAVLGLAFIVLGFVPILASMNRLHVHAWIVMGFGAFLLAIGYIIGGS